jgi:hypothetical protein
MFIDLREVGKVLSSASKEKIQAAIDALTALINMAEAKSTEVAHAFLEAVQLSFSDRQEEVRDALRAKYGTGPNTWVYLIDCYDDFAIYTIEQDTSLVPSDRKTYQVSYSILDGAVTLGAPFEVERVVSYVPVMTQESAVNEAAKPPTRTENGKVFSKGDFAYTPSDAPMSWKLRLAAEPGAGPDSAMVGAACAALGPGFRGQKVEIPEADVAAVKAAVRAAWKKANPDKKPTDMPAGIKESEATESADVELTGDLVPLVEAKAIKDGAARVRVIAPGWGSSGWYSPQVLQDSAPAFKDVPIFWDHPTTTEEATRPERSLRDLAGKLIGTPTYEANGPVGAGLYADVQIFKPFQEHLQELAPHVGMSIRASGQAKQGEAEGRKGPIIEKIVAARSVDVVTSPGAGGRILQSFQEAARGGHHIDQSESKGDIAVNEQEIQALREARTVAELEATRLREANATLLAENTRLKEANLLAEAKRFVVETLGQVKGLPELTRDRLVESLSTRPMVKDGQLDRDGFAHQINDDARREMSYLEAVMGTGRIRGMGSVDGGNSIQQDQTQLAESFKRLGLSDGAVKIAVAGR